MASSSTAQHILAVLLTELERFAHSGPLRVLDAGCGDGALLRFLARALAATRSSFTVELYGFDVDDHDVQQPGFLAQTVLDLAAALPFHDWRGRIRLVRSTDPWPFADGMFHAVVSNQVLEHVRDAAAFAVETGRVLVPDGFAVHVFPLRSCIWEPHLHLPGAHWISDHDTLRSFIAGLSWLGLGKYGAHARLRQVSRQRFAEEHADYLHFLTAYRTRRQWFDLARGAGLRPSLRYTSRYFGQRVRRLLGRAPAYRYPSQPAVLHAVAGWLLPLLASCTLFLEKRQVYRE